MSGPDPSCGLTRPLSLRRRGAPTRVAGARSDQIRPIVSPPDSASHAHGHGAAMTLTTADRATLHRSSGNGIVPAVSCAQPYAGWGGEARSALTRKWENTRGSD